MKFVKYIAEKASIFDKDPDYMVVDTKVPNSYIVSKWTHGKAPKDVYHVTGFGGKWKCDCPVMSTCKHIKLVKDWLKAGKPSPLGPDFDKDLKDFVKKYNIV